LESEYGFDRWEALEVLSQVGSARVAKVSILHDLLFAREEKAG